MTNPKGSKLEPKLKLDMPFAEAMARFDRVKHKDVVSSRAKAKRAQSTAKRKRKKLS
jgi:hypothetical protein